MNTDQEIERNEFAKYTEGFRDGPILICGGCNTGMSQISQGLINRTPGEDIIHNITLGSIQGRPNVLSSNASQRVNEIQVSSLFAKIVNRIC